jgi:hypothetical protein
MNNITDALVYTTIKNNLTPQNFTKYNELLKKLDKTDNNELNIILSNTTIKKGCCDAVESLSDKNKYETIVHYIDGKNPYGKKTVTFDKSICEKEGYYKNTKKCSDFKTLYCENSKLLYDNDDINIEGWNTYSKYCINYVFIEPEIIKKEDAIDKGIQKKVDDYIQEYSKDDKDDKDDKTNNDLHTDKESEDSNITKYALIGGSILLFLFIIISIFYVILKKKGK